VLKYTTGGWLGKLAGFSCDVLLLLSLLKERRITRYHRNKEQSGTFVATSSYYLCTASFHIHCGEKTSRGRIQRQAEITHLQES